MKQGQGTRRPRRAKTLTGVAIRSPTWPSHQFHKYPINVTFTKRTWTYVKVSLRLQTWCNPQPAKSDRVRGWKLSGERSSHTQFRPPPEYCLVLGFWSLSSLTLHPHLANHQGLPCSKGLIHKSLGNKGQTQEWEIRLTVNNYFPGNLHMESPHAKV